MKKYDLIDVMKLFFAMAIVTLHVPQTNSILTIFSQYVGRIGVPFFFAVAGFFLYAKLEKGNEKTVVLKYLRRVLKLWLIWMVIYLPLLLIQIVGQVDKKEALLKLLWEIIFKTPAYLWYLPALCCGCVLLAWSAKRNLKIYTILSILLYVIGCTGNTYLYIFHADNIWKGYLSVFLTTRNGLFFAPILLGIGALLKKYEDSLSQGKGWMAFGGMLILYIAEVSFVVNSGSAYEDCSFYFTLPMLVMCILGVLMSSNASFAFAQQCRRMSTWIYCSQFGFLTVFGMVFTKTKPMFETGGTIKWMVAILASIVTYLLLQNINYGRKLLNILI